MTELFVALAGAGAALFVWRALKTLGEPSYNGAVPSGFGVMTQRPGLDIHHWPRLGLFNFEIAETAHPMHQHALREVFEQQGAYCVATLVPQGNARDTGTPVAVHLGTHRVGFLTMGDATRFHRRLAYEGRCGQLSQCGAYITWAEQGRRSKTLTILLDLKPFRH